MSSITSTMRSTNVNVPSPTTQPRRLSFSEPTMIATSSDTQVQAPEKTIYNDVNYFREQFFDKYDPGCFGGRVGRFKGEFTLSVAKQFAKAKPNSATAKALKELGITDYNEKFVLTPVQRLFNTIRIDDLFIFIKAISEPSFNIMNFITSDGETLLHIAAHDGSEKIVLYIIENFPQLIHSVDHKNQTPLHMCLLKNRFEIASILINCMDSKVINSFSNGRPDVNSNSMNDDIVQYELGNKGFNALSWAVWSENKKLAELIIEKTHYEEINIDIIKDYIEARLNAYKNNTARTRITPEKKKQTEDSVRKALQYIKELIQKAWETIKLAHEYTDKKLTRGTLSRSLDLFMPPEIGNLTGTYEFVYYTLAQATEHLIKQGVFNKDGKPKSLQPPISSDDLVPDSTITFTSSRL